MFRGRIVVAIGAMVWYLDFMMIDLAISLWAVLVPFVLGVLLWRRRDRVSSDGFSDDYGIADVDKFLSEVRSPRLKRSSDGRLMVASSLPEIDWGYLYSEPEEVES